MNSVTQSYKKPSHTPGPWTVGSRRHIYAGEGMDRACFVNVFSGPELDADANLIAAAPDLLAALQKIVAMVDAVTFMEDLDPADLLKIAGKAIDKATGTA